MLAVGHIWIVFVYHKVSYFPHTHYDCVDSTSQMVSKCVCVCFCSSVSVNGQRSWFCCPYLFWAVPSHAGEFIMVCTVRRLAYDPLHEKECQTSVLILCPITLIRVLTSFEVTTGDNSHLFSFISK